MNHREYQYLEPEVWIAEVLHLLSLEEFTELLNECVPYALATPSHFFVSSLQVATCSSRSRSSTRR
jgi:hypothetical protein